MVTALSVDSLLQLYFDAFTGLYAEKNTRTQQNGSDRDWYLVPEAEYVAPFASGRICRTMVTHSLSELACPTASSVPPVPSPISSVVHKNGFNSLIKTAFRRAIIHVFYGRPKADTKIALKTTHKCRATCHPGTGRYARSRRHSAQSSPILRSTRLRYRKSRRWPPVAAPAQRACQVGPEMMHATTVLKETGGERRNQWVLIEST